MLFSILSGIPRPAKIKDSGPRYLCSSDPDLGRLGLFFPEPRRVLGFTVYIGLMAP